MSKSEKVILRVVSISLFLIFSLNVGIVLKDYFDEKTIIRACAREGFKEYICIMKATGRLPCNSFNFK